MDTTGATRDSSTDSSRDLTRDDPEDEVETFNPWSIVHLVFEHLSDAGLHPTLGAGGDPGVHAGALLRALDVEPSAEGNKAVARGVRSHLAEIRAVMLEEPSQGDTSGGPAQQSHHPGQQPAPEQGDGAS